MLETIRKLFRHQKKPQKIWRPGRGYTVEVVGESHYQTELHRITGGKTWDGHNLECQAVLVVNEHGWDGEPAVLVRIKGPQRSAERVRFQVGSLRVLRDSPVRRLISRTDCLSRSAIRRMMFKSPMWITPLTPRRSPRWAGSSHGSILNGNYAPNWLSFA